MMSEAVHSVADTSNKSCTAIIVQIDRPDEFHPLGYGRVLYFSSLIVALLIFALDSGVSLHQGILHVLNPEPIEDPVVSYVVLGLSFLFEGVSWLIALRRFGRTAKGSDIKRHLSVDRRSGR